MYRRHRYSLCGTRLYDENYNLMKPLPPEPEKPLRDDCCGGGSCCPCIWDVYYEKLAAWKDAKKEHDAQAPSSTLTNEE